MADIGCLIGIDMPHLTFHTIRYPASAL